MNQVVLVRERTSPKSDMAMQIKRRLQNRLVDLHETADEADPIPVHGKNSI